jgi:type IV pilus assembly protein PilY1
VFRNLIELTKPSYAHQYYVDGSPTMGDAYDGSKWHTMLVGGLNKGGQGIYALDVTDPSSFSEANASSLVKWEFDDNDDPDLGYTYSRPVIVKMHNGKWAAVFGNGYNNTLDDTAVGGKRSTTGNAVLYVVDLFTGALIKKIDTGVGRVQDPMGQSRPNGLATPALVDTNGDSVADYAFAGDLFGNLWKFDLRAANETSWGVAFGNTPLFVAKDGTAATAKVQPITERPEVARGPNGKGMIVLFGTGKFLEGVDRDVAQLSKQTFYGIIDLNTAGSGVVTNGRADLTAQTITREGVQSGKKFRVTTQNTVSNRGWYLDLVSPGTPPTGGFKGEMSVSDPIVRNGRVIFTTLIPTPDPCLFGGTSWLMELDALSGARLSYPPIDLNNDGKFDDQDRVTDENGNPVQLSGMETDVGITAKAGVLAGKGAEYKYQNGTAVSATTGTNMSVTRENPGPADVGRQSWRQMR